MSRSKTFLLGISLLALLPFSVVGYHFPSVDELPVQNDMPDPFIMEDGSRVQSLEDWNEQKKYIRAMLEHYLYGTVPPLPKQVEVEKHGSESVFNGKGLRETYTLTIRRNGLSASSKLVVVRPRANKRYPTIIKNDRVAFDKYEDENLAENPKYAKVLKRLQAKLKELDENTQFAGKEAVRRGYLLCRFEREALATDARGEDRSAGVYPLYPEYTWRALAVWGWAHGIVLDALNQFNLVDMNKVVATGHSRGGKAALCAGIFDERVTITAPNSSGTGGTGSYRFFEEGQRPQSIKSHIGKYELWFPPAYFTFAEKEERMPFDSHFSRVLVAPRAFLNCHARQDYHANPYGTELTHHATRVVYEWMEAGDKIALHWREGGHAQNIEDWSTLFDFSDQQFFGKPSNTSFNNWAYPDAELPFSWKAPE